MQALSISELERQTGISRTTIHYYITVGLLPPAQKASPTRAVYDRSHVELLHEITRLKGEGLTLKEIEERLAPRVEAALESTVDLVSQQHENVRKTILEVAARRFAELGYDQTRISDICKAVGVTAPFLYGYFPSKRHLFIACFQVYFDWTHAELAKHVAATDDSAVHQAWWSWANYARQAFSPDLQALARVEAFHPESELRPLVRETYESMLAGPWRDLTAEKQPGGNPGLFDDELIAYGMLGALENMQMRASWDGKYSVKDVMRNRIAMFLAIRAAYAGRVDLMPEWERVAELVDRLASATRRPRSRGDEAALPNEREKSADT
jgi:AcrR family transcriptional regulator/predicted DNA-binding transcriptional regulator AlpA